MVKIGFVVFLIILGSKILEYVHTFLVAKILGYAGVYFCWQKYCDLEVAKML